MTEEVQTYYGVRRQPELAGFFETPQGRAEMDAAKRMLLSGNIAVVFGDVGMGKSRMLWQLRCELEQNESARIAELTLPNPERIKPNELTRMLLHSLDAEAKIPRDPEKRRTTLLARLRSVGKPVVVVFDYSHELPYETLEALRDFILELRQQSIILSLLLAGQPELVGSLKNVLWGYSAIELALLDLDGFLENRHAFTEWLIRQCPVGKRVLPILPPEAVTFLSESHRTPLGIVQGFKHVLETGFTRQINPITLEVVKEAERTYPYGIRC